MSDSVVSEQNGNVRVTPTTGSFSVGGVAPAGYQFFATSATASVPTALQLHSNYAFAGTSFVGNFGEYGTYISQNRDPKTGAYVNAAAAPNQKNAVTLILGDTQRNRHPATARKYGSRHHGVFYV